MNRLWQPHSEAVAEGLRYVPARLKEAIECDVFCGDPLFAQIFVPKWSIELSDLGYSYREVCHCAYPYHTKDRRTTVVLPYPPTPVVVVHELGHVLDWALRQRAGLRAMPHLEEVSWYAHTNRREAFAEAWTLYCCYTPEGLDRLGQDHWKWSKPNAEWFRRLLRA